MKNPRRFRILVTITVLFTTLIVVFGLVFREFIYYQTSQLLHNGSQRYFAQISTELSLEYRAVHRAVSQAVHIIGNTDIANAVTLEQRLHHAPSFLAAIEDEPELAGLQVGYDDGDYFIVRPINNNYLRNHFSAPPKAAFVIDNLSRAEDGYRYLERIWYNSDHREIRRNTKERSVYDPRIRPWYTKAIEHPGQAVATHPYLFHFIRQMGLTIGYKVPGRNVVIAGDIPLHYLSRTVAKYRQSPNSELILVEDQSNGPFLVTAYHDSDKLVVGTGENMRRTTIKDLDSPILSFAEDNPQFLSSFYSLDFASEKWFGSTIKIDIPNNDKLYLIQLSPQDELLVDAHRMQTQALNYTLAMILVCITLTWLIARKISTPLQDLAGEAIRISHFQFGNKRIGGSSIKEVDELARAMSLMEMTIGRFLSLITSLASEQDFDKLLTRITGETMSVSEANAAFSYVVEESSNILRPGSLQLCGGESQAAAVLPTLSLSEDSQLVQLLRKEDKATIAVAGSPVEHALPADLHGESANIVVFPLRSRHREMIGLLCLVFSSKQEMQSATRAGRIAFTQELSGFAAVTLESRKMLRMQKRLLDSFIKLMAGAIDSKSPYTGGHCLRVPEIARMLAEKACEAKDGPFSNFDLTDDEWEELHIASWLHDCGKVTTPEFVVDKATKLECIYDRIHEIRMRFEVLKRDAHLTFWEKLTAGGEAKELQKKLDEEWQQLDEEFAFIAECNLGGEYMAEERIKRLREIGARNWMRTIDDRQGISWEEMRRKDRMPKPKLPVREHLLADKEEHRLPRSDRQKIAADNIYGFKLDTPEHLFNRGELYNLAISRGTLTAEDRYIINDHIVQTIIMLKQLPYPRHLQDVPDIAGSHHERIDGTGYPRRLMGEEMSVQAKIMVIADIYEALTATDRPYKKGKDLSQVITIMNNMKDRGHIDPDLFRLFLASGTYLEYARHYLQPEQIVEVDISRYT